jgi:hypothetical protein
MSWSRGLGVFVLASLSATAGCSAEVAPNQESDEHTAKSSEPLAYATFDLDAYELTLARALGGPNPVGYSYAIYQDGALLRTGAAGNARLPFYDGTSLSGGVPWTADVPFSMMSMGKTITAAAFARLFAERGTDALFDTQARFFLPTGWKPDSDFDTVTFRMLFSHTSGLTTSVDPWAADKTEVETDVLPPGSTSMANGNTTPQPAGVGTFFYSNTNFTLGGRVLMAYVLDEGAARMAQLYGMGPTYTSQVYRLRVLSSIFAPLGLGMTQVDDRPIGQYPAGFYDMSGSQFYFEPTDGTTILNAGAGYWNLSVKSYGKFIDALSHGKYDVVKPDGTVVSPWKAMTTMVAATNSPDVGLGLFRAHGQHGNYFTHDGGWTNGKAGACARWMTYPNGLSAVWVVNSAKPGSNGKLVCPVNSSQQMMVDAYDNAWSAPIILPPIGI